MSNIQLRSFKQMPATYILIGICVVVFVAKFLLESFAGDSDAYYNYRLLGLWVPGVVRYGHWWTFVTSMFMHGSIIHLMCNMVSLYYLGTLMERLYGTVRFLVLYFVSGLAGGALYVALNIGVNAYAVGASGAIFGLFGAYGILLILENMKPFLFPPQATKNSLNSFLGLLVMNLFISFSPGIAWQAHIGGLVAGAIVGALYYWWLKRERLAESGG